MQPKTSETAQLEAAFSELAEQIKKDTGLSSRISGRLEHPAYQKVTEMGESVLSLIFPVYRRGEREIWPPALEAITGANPTLPPRPITAGRVDLDIIRMERDWLKWAKNRGIIESIAGEIFGNVHRTMRRLPA